MTLTIRLLGTPTVIRDSELLEGFISVKSRALLFYLAMKPGIHSRQTLAALLWPETTETAAAKNLRNVLSNLRKLVGAHIDITRRTVAFRRDAAYLLDVEQFSALLERYRRDKADTGILEQAVLLYAGDFLEGFHVVDSDIFEAWLISEREQLRQAQLEALGKLATLYTELSDFNKGLDYVSQLLTLDNFSETGQQLKMAILAQKGQRNEALAQYAEFCGLLDEELGVTPTAETTRLYEQIKAGSYESESTDVITIKQPPRTQYRHIDWGDIPGEVPFYGREEQLKQLQQWLTDEDSLSEGRRFIAITGMGGVGKTAFTARLTRRLAEQPRSYGFIIWRSLINAPPLTAVLRSWLTILSGQQLVELPETMDEQLLLLLRYLQEERCLLILDNYESVLETGVRAGQYRSGFEEYGQLIRRVGGGRHQSCLLITSREQPQGLSRIGMGTVQAGIMNLSGLPDEAGIDMLRAQGIDGSDETLAEIVHLYSGNPLALKLVVDTAKNLFAGDIDLLMEETAVFGDIHDVLNEQFSRLTPLEDGILTWLAIEREPVTAQTILDNLALRPHKRQFLEALRSLYFRSLLEQAQGARQNEPAAAPHYTLQNVVREHATSRLVEAVCQEISANAVNRLQQYALLKAQTKEFIQESQRRLLLEPVAQWLEDHLGKAGAVNNLQRMLETVRADPALATGYVGANILNLLLALGEELHGYDFSYLPIRQADLRAVILHNVSFKGSDLSGSIFRDTFSLVKNVAFSPDGQLLTAGASDGSITFWRLLKYQPHLIIQRGSGYDIAVAFSPNGQVLVGGGNDHEIRFWDVATGSMLRRLSEHSGMVMSVCFSPDGSTLFSSSEDLTVAIWDVHSGRVLRQIPTPGNIILALEVSPNGQLLAGGGYDGTLYLWETHSGTFVRSLGRDLTEKIHTLAFSPDGDLLAAAGEDNEIHVWHVNSGEKVVSLHGHTNMVLSIAFHPDGTTLASGSADKTVRLWDWRQERTKRVFPGSTNWVTCIAFSPDGTIIAAGGYDRKVRLWQYQSGDLLHALQGSLKNVNEVTFSRDGGLIASASFDQPVRLWDAHTGHLLHLLQGHSGSIRRLVFSPDDSTLAVSGDDKVVRLWDTQTGKLQQIFVVNDSFVRTLVFSPDGKLLAAGVGLGYGKLFVWEIATRRLLLSKEDVRTSLEYSFSFSPDGRFLAYSDSSYALCIINVRDDVVCRTMPAHNAPVELVRFAPNGSLLVSQDRNGELYVWQVAVDGSIVPIIEFQGKDANADIWNLAFSRDCKMLAFQIDSDTVGVLDMNDGRLYCSLETGLYGECCLAFSHENDALITSGDDGRIRVWNVESGECLHTLQEGVLGVIDMNPDGFRLAGGGDDGVIRIWNIQTGSCDLSLTPSGPYDGLDITGAVGLSPAQAATLEALGAVTQQ